MLAAGALFWPARKTLIVADLHLEKGSWFASQGQHLPPYDSAETLSRLLTIVVRLGAAELWCLGDNFHDSAGPTRLTADATALLGQLAAKTAIRWIVGNHDGDANATLSLPGTVHEQVEEDQLVFRHEALPKEERFELSGHFHPKVRFDTRAKPMSRPCFARFGSHLLLPSFGALTGGLDVSDPAYAGLRSGDDEAIVVTERALLRLPLDHAQCGVRAPRKRAPGARLWR